jgi:hypothetical protein
LLVGEGELFVEILKRDCRDGDHVLRGRNKLKLVKRCLENRRLKSMVTMGAMPGAAGEASKTSKRHKTRKRVLHAT